MNLFQARQVGSERAKHMGSPGSNKQAQGRSDGGEQECFRQQLRDQHGARGPERKSHGNFMLAMCRARQKQRHDIDAGNQEKKGHRAKEEPERLARTANDGLLQGLDFDNQVRVGFWILFSKLRLNRVQVGARLLQAHTGLEASDNAIPGTLPALGVGRVGRASHPEVDVVVRKAERGGKHSDNQIGRTKPAEHNSLSDYVRVCGEPAAPKAVADKDGLRSAKMLFL